MIRDSKQRLFEMMNRVGGMPLVETDGSAPRLPSWAMSGAKDFIPLEVYEKQVPCNTNIQEVERDLKPNATAIDDPIKWMQDKDASIAAGTKQDVEHGGRLGPLMMANSRKGDYKINQIDAKKLTPIERDKVKLPVDQKSDYDLEELGRILSVPPSPSQIIGQNGKMGKTNFYNITLPAWRGIFYDEVQKKFYIINVCDKADTCAKVCFAQMGHFVIHDHVIRLNSQKLNYLLNHADTWKGRIINGIKALYDGFNTTVVRWHDSGDFFSEEYMRLAFEVAEATDASQHYAYTKEVSMARSLKSIQPSNFEFKFSFGGKEDNLIRPTEDGYAVIVPTPVFADLQPDEEKFNKKTKKTYIGKGWKFDEKAMEVLKQRIVDFAKKTYNIDVPFESLITHNELINKQYKEPHTRKWNVIGVSGDSDISALRRDVAGIYLLQHK